MIIFAYFEVFAAVRLRNPFFWEETPPHCAVCFRRLEGKRTLENKLNMFLRNVEGR